MKNIRFNKFQLLLLFTACTCNAFAQSKTLTGSKYSPNNSYILDLDATDLAPVSLPFSSKITQTSSGLYNENGDITFFTNGCNIYNGQDIALLENTFHVGTDLDTFCFRQGGMIRNGVVLLIAPSDHNLMNVIYLKGKLGNSKSAIVHTGLFLRTMNLGEKTWSDEIEIKNGNLSKFSYTKKGDGSGYWVIIADLDSNELLTFDISKETVTLSNTASYPLPTSTTECPLDLNLKFSPDGKKIAFHHSSCYLAIYDFDECTGKPIGPRMNFSGGSSDNPDNCIEFTKDSKFIIVGREKYQATSRTKITSNEVLVYDVDKLGLQIEPIFSFATPINFSVGSIFTNKENRILIFNRFSDHYYLDLEWSAESSSIINGNFKRLPFRYYPAFSMLEYQYPLSVNNCINTAYALDLDFSYKIFPNPASDHFIIGLNNGSIEKCVANIISADGRLISSFITEINKVNDINGLPNGLYTIKLFSLQGEYFTSKKIIITK